jgi:hypothetical protein
MRDQRLGGNAALDQPLRRWRRYHLAAGVFWTRITVTSCLDALSPSAIRCAGWRHASRPSESK